MIKSVKVHDKPLPASELLKKFGLGDAVAAALKPAVAVSDALLGTDLRNCKSCHGKGGRQERLNELLPDLLNPFKKPEDQS